MEHLTEEEKERLNNNLTIIKGKTVQTCIRLIKMLEEFDCDEEEFRSALKDLEDRADSDANKMILRRQTSFIQAPPEVLEKVALARSRSPKYE